MTFLFYINRNITPSAQSTWPAARLQLYFGETFCAANAILPLALLPCPDHEISS